MAYPTWVTNVEEQKLHDDFVFFVTMLWRHLRLPQPTKRQKAMARYLQTGPKRRMLQAWRGAAKTWLTCAYVLWRLYRNPNERVKIVSANEDKAIENATFVRRLIEEVPELQFLRPRGNSRDSVLAFDVGPSDAHPTPSVSAVGITGQLTGGRATILVSDDVEVPKNSYTESMRARLAELVKEYDALIVPGGEIIYLGTPQTEQSIYRVVRTRGYDCRIWPARFPGPQQAAKYDGCLAPDIRTDLLQGARVGASTDPERFSDEDLASREGSYGRSGFALQFMLDTTLSDAERYPLKQADLILTDAQPTDAPLSLGWTSDPRQVAEEIPNVGFAGDRLHRPLFIGTERAPYQSCVMVVDPSGRGRDDTAVTVLKSLAGWVWITAIKGFKGGYDDTTLLGLSKLAKDHGVKHILLESNFGDGMFQKLWEPVLAKIHPCTIEEYRSTGQKELRIIDDIEPVLNQHRLVLDASAAREDAALADADPAKSFLYQLTHLTKDRGSLRHDDKIEVVSRGCRYFREQLGIDHKTAEQRHMDALRTEEFRRYERAALGKNSAANPNQKWVKGPSVLRRKAKGPQYRDTFGRAKLGGM